jgi:hypothetical protein
MSVRTLKKPEKAVQSESKAAAVPHVDHATFDRKAEEMKIFLSLNPIPEEFLKKK